MSSGFANAIGTRMARLNDNVGSTNNLADAGFLGGNSNVNTGYSSNGVSTHLYLMKGTIPATPTVATLATRQADMLVRFVATSHNGGGDFVTSQMGTNPVVMSTQYAAAVLAGTATWFWLVTAPGSTSSATFYADFNGAILYQVTGTVGITGSGADMEVPNVNIVLNEQYRVLNFRLQIPTSWTY
jgi:hypothetical protein